MKKTTILLITICVVVMTAGTGMAADVDFSGEYYIEGIYNSNPNLAKTDLATYYRQMRLRVQTDFKVTEDLKLTTRFDALEKVWNTDDSAFTNSEDAENIDFDRAYMTIISKVGMFMLGRQEGVTWGTTWADDEDDTDRFKWVLPLDAAGGKLIFALIAEKTTENDTDPDITSGKDNDKYYFGTIYKREKYDTGLLFGLYDFNRTPDPQQREALDKLKDQGYEGLEGLTRFGTLAAGYRNAAIADYVAANDGNPDTLATNVAAFEDANDHPGMAATIAAVGTAPTVLATRGATCEANIWLASPYFRGKFDKLGVQAELDYVFGTIEYTDLISSTGLYSTEPDHDVSAYSYFLEATYDVGPVVVQAGWAHRSGDSDESDTDEGAMGYFAPGIDWEKMFILSSDYHGLNTSLAGIGNHVGDGYITFSRPLLDGFQMPYIGVDYSVRDDITLGLLAAMSTADDTVTGWDDDQGVEVDLKFTWQLMDNLKYQATFAYLSAGDYWKQGNAATDLDDLYCLFSRLTMTF
ncbi:MAG: hypothetical protein ABIK15_10815 [Pseudomonadota bacterium]